MHFQARPISFKPSRLQGLSARLLASHYENNYGGAVKRLGAIEETLASLDIAKAPVYTINGLKREQLIAMNSMLPPSRARSFFATMALRSGHSSRSVSVDCLVKRRQPISTVLSNSLRFGEPGGGRDRDRQVRPRRRPAALTTRR